MAILLGATPLVAEASGSDTWRTGSPMPTALYAAGAATVGGLIYVVGGENASGITNIVQVYNPVADSWSSGAPLPQGVRGEAVVVVGTDLYVLGGYTSAGATGAVWRLPAGGTAWVSGPAMPTPLGDVGSAVVGRRIYVIGGNGANTLRSNVVEVYNTPTGKWKSAPDLLVGKSELSGGAIAGSVYAAGGYTLNEDTGDTESLARGATTWTALAPEPAATNQACTGVVNKRLYMLGGAHDHPAVGDANAYDPATNSWSTETAMPTAASYAAGAVYKGRIYCFGGSDFDTGGTYYDLTQIYHP